MKTKFRINTTFVYIIIFFLFSAVVTGTVYYKGRQRKPLVYAVIPEITDNWLNMLNDIYKFGITHDQVGPFDWENEKDFGAVNAQWSDLDIDPNFTIYYKNDKRNEWRINALKTLDVAKGAIPDLEGLMGKYYYPSDMNGRKLAIYLPPTEEDFVSTIDELMGRPTNSTGAIGMCVTEVGPLGAINRGIVINPSCYDPLVPEINGFEKTLRHEMNHYVYFSSLKYDHDINHYLWVSEGLAEYFCGSHNRQISMPDSIDFIDKHCHLDDDFPIQNNAAYWAGESFYKFVEDTCGIDGTRNFIQSLYTSDTDVALSKLLPDSVDVHVAWVNSLREPQEIER